MRTSSKRVRIQFDFTTTGVERLDSLMDDIGATTRAEVIRRALNLYIECLEAVKERQAKVGFYEVGGEFTRVLL